MNTPELLSFKSCFTFLADMTYITTTAFFGVNNLKISEIVPQFFLYHLDETEVIPSFSKFNNGGG
jgi:hypothetical protein